MRKRLPALLSFMLSALLLGSCGKDSYKDNSVLILADSLMQTYPDSATVGRNICTTENGESEPGMVCATIDAGKV